jgi:hypothetical protein
MTVARVGIDPSCVNEWELLKRRNARYGQSRDSVKCDTRDVHEMVTSLKES